MHLHLTRQSDPYARLDWEPLRHAGDEQFYDHCSQGKMVELVHDPYAPTFGVRPKDFATAREWVAANVGEANRLRLLRALEVMLADDDVYLVASR